MGKQMAACSEHRLPAREAGATRMLGSAGMAAPHGSHPGAREPSFSQPCAGLCQGGLPPGALTGLLVTSQPGWVGDDLKTTP